jgi:inner membrane protein
MASLFTHAVVGASVGQAGRPSAWNRWPFWWVATLCSIAPDADVIGFSMGIHYGDLWGHRGMTHSLLFAALLGMAVAVLGGCTRNDRWKAATLLFLVTASHGVLDAMTNGGLGVAFFSPFDTTRYFLPWRPVVVSPIGILGLAPARGFHILWTEIVWMWVPTMAVAVAIWALRRSRKPRALSTSAD